MEDKEENSYFRLIFCVILLLILQVDSYICVYRLTSLVVSSWSEIPANRVTGLQSEQYISLFFHPGLMFLALSPCLPFLLLCVMVFQ